MNKFVLFICKENNAEIKDKRTSVGEEMRKKEKNIEVIEKLIPKKRCKIKKNLKALIPASIGSWL